MMSLLTVADGLSLVTLMRNSELMSSSSRARENSSMAALIALRNSETFSPIVLPPKVRIILSTKISNSAATTSSEVPEC